MPRIWAVVVCCCVPAGAALAQDLDQGLAAAQTEIAAERWQPALDILLPLCGRDVPAPVRAQLAVALVDVGQGLRRASSFAPSLAAHEAALRERRLLHGDADHADVAASLGRVASARQSLGLPAEALPEFEAALAMRKRLHGEGDEPEVAYAISDVADCLYALGRGAAALPLYEDSLAMRRRIHGEGDHRDVATGISDLGECLLDLGRPEAALPLHQDALAMRQRIHDGRDHADVALSLTDLGCCLMMLGNAEAALPHCESGLAMRRRLYGDRDHPWVALSLNNLATCLRALGRAVEAVPLLEAALAMDHRIHGGRDHPAVAHELNNVAVSLDSIGRRAEALPRFEAALAMRRRLYGDRDHPEVATSINNVAVCLRLLGRAADAKPRFEAALAMLHRIHAGEHPDMATTLTNLADCFEMLGRPAEALTTYEAAVAMSKRVHGGRDHPDVARGLTNLGGTLQTLDRAAEALPWFEAALAMFERIPGGRDHPDRLVCMNNVGSCLDELGRPAEALPQFVAAAAMAQGMYGDRDFPDRAVVLHNYASCLRALDRVAEALPLAEQALAMVERIRDTSALGPELRQSLFDELKRGDHIERMQAMYLQVGKPADALGVSERSRGRGLLDLVEGQRFEPFDEAELRARQRGDEATLERVRTVRRELQAVELEHDQLFHLLTRLGDEPLEAAARQARRDELLARSDSVGQRRRELLDDRARLLADVLPVGRVRTAAEIQACLQPGEALLQFTITPKASFVYVLARGAEVEAVALPDAFATVERVVPALVAAASSGQLAARGRDPETAAAPGRPSDTPVDARAEALVTASRALFDSLVPPAVWQRIRTARRVFVAPHRSLHRVPLELLVTDVQEGKPVHWLVSGPPIAYVPSGSALHWLRRRAREASDDATSLDLLAVGDPRRLDAEPAVPEEGTFVVAVDDGGEGARVGLQPGDVLLRYDGKPLVDDKSLRDLRTATEAAIEDGQRAGEPIRVAIWRRGAEHEVEVRAGRLGIQVGIGKARRAFEASLGSDEQLGRVTRAGDLERIARLPPLRGARAETEAIARVFADKGRKARPLVGEEATESAVFDLAAKAKYLHFACHGVAEEYAGSSLSMLVLSQPLHVLPGDDGLLDLGDLLHAWRGRLGSCRLVVLSACRTNIGPTLRDEAPQALPLGFLFAGAPAVVSSLWAVDDASTKELMSDFYGRLLEGATDRLQAFTDARKKLRERFPDPFHWAPFLYMGSPE